MTGRQVRAALRAHTADQVGRVRYLGTADELYDLADTAHDPEATDEQAEAAALAFLDAWYPNPVNRKSARYGLILHTLRHRPDLASRVDEFSAYLRDRLSHDGIEAWYDKYTGHSRADAA